MKENDTIKEFIEVSGYYIKTLRAVNDKEMCPICGMKADSFEKLVEAVKELQEKAWKYDDLCD